ncbi:hypothetical protein [Paenibacillus macerans]|uniref:hypothetical protein n=1 Tax=Paenibacillus macerans TaxID=44252 RepID=UPI003D318097
MNAIKLASTYFFGTEPFVRGNSMIATVTFKTAIAYDRLFAGYRQLVMDHPMLQSKRVELPGQDTFEWGRFTDEELEKLLNDEMVLLSRFYTEEEVLGQYAPTNARLPFHLFRIDEFTIMFSLNHALANGLSLVYWIRRWLEYYAGESRAKPGSAGESGGWQEKLLRLQKRIAAFLWMPAFVLGFIAKAYGKAPRPGDTVDLSGGELPLPGGRYVKKPYRFGKQETKAILRRCREKGMTLTEYLCCQLTAGLLEQAPDQKRVFVSMPMDLQLLHPYSPETAHGNYVASLPMQFFRGGDLAKQVKGAFKWFKRGVPYALALFFASFSNSFRKYKQQCLELSMKPMPQRFPLWNFTMTYSNLGVLSYPIFEEWVDSVYFSIKNQSILLTSASLSGCLMMELGVLDGLYDAEAVFGMFDRILSAENLLGSAEPEFESVPDPRLKAV